MTRSNVGDSTTAVAGIHHQTLTEQRSSQCRIRARSARIRPKRAQYVANACDACRGRKVRCTGQKPCERCSKFGIHCDYGDGSGSVPVTEVSEATSAYEAMNYSPASHIPGVETPENVVDGAVQTLKLVLAMTLLAEGGGRHTIGEAMCKEVQQELVFPMGRLGELKDVENMALLGVSFYFMNDENQAWRMIGLAARLCIELGLHQAKIYQMHPNSKSSTRAITLFWDVYILDQRFSLSTGRPFAIQDIDIDPALPKLDNLSPYVRNMITFASIGSRVWASRIYIEGSGLHGERDKIAYLDFQIQQWSNALPSALRLFNTQTSSLADINLATTPNTPLDFTGMGDKSLFIRALLYLRANELRILIHRPALHSSDSIQKNPLSARAAVNVARRSLNLLLYLCRLPTLHPMHHVCATHFLDSSLTVLLLAVSHAPETLGAEIRDQLLSALSLLEDLSTTTSHSESL
ncbi:fungal specific transcription factor domain-containing protein [Trichoderma breve]|uniref:Fungal specific transcription factor domain-containing protein n=1 Tax=Trichoderma breve TaxID=2034170 RepID=A0A9W9EF63_9HYPO|nr:fungal specific transcription factor domain-containing protein [Trichoderma breve]KAJ4865586.1 fungal specific transcription factor domain-containing protein [Trichoderma breve]